MKRDNHIKQMNTNYYIVGIWAWLEIIADAKQPIIGARALCSKTTLIKRNVIHY